jgi:hypothetical protein
MLWDVPMTELRELAKPFPSSLVERAPGGFGDFVTWSVKVEKLLATVGPFDWCIVREITDPDGTITGAVGRLTLTIDGVTVSVEGAGDVERPDILANNGTRLKHAESDALSRAASKVSVGLSLWSQDKYRLDRALDRKKEVDRLVEEEKRLDRARMREEALGTALDEQEAEK